jgi:heme exporter protein C
MMMATRNQLMLGVALLIFAAAPWIIHAAPYESTMGLVQKIFYFHLPGALMMLFVALFAGAMSALFLFGKKQWADHYAVAAAEQVVLFGAMTMVTGPLWARKAWGVWWEWEPRLTSSLLLWMIFIAYLLLRRFGGPGSEKLASGIALFALANVPFIYVSVNYWRTMHPKTTVLPNLIPEWAAPVWMCFAGFLLLSLVFFSLRVRLEAQRARVEALYLAADED